jgi:hypothetical protein
VRQVPLRQRAADDRWLYCHSAVLAVGRADRISDSWATC